MEFQIDFKAGDAIVFAEVPEEYEMLQGANKDVLGLVYPLFVWKVEMVDPGSSADGKVLHRQRLIILRVFDGETYINVGNKWVLEEEYKASSLKDKQKVRWWSGFWFKTV